MAWVSPGRDVEVEAVEHVPGVAVAVGEADALEAHRAAHRLRAARRVPGRIDGSTSRRPKMRRHDAMARW